MFRHPEPCGKGSIQRAVLLSVAGCLAASLLVAAGAAGDPPDPKNEARLKRLALHGGGATSILTRTLGATELRGKKMPAPVDEPGTDPGTKAGVTGTLSHADPQTDVPPKSPNNVAIRYFPNVHENEPTVAVNPKNPKRVVAGTHFIASSPGNRCVAHYSRDGGKSWNPIPIFMRQLTHQSQCSDPVLAYAPDGSRVYYAYMDIDFSTTFKILVSYSDDDGKSWKGPVVALSASGADYDKPWLGTHVAVGDDDDDEDNATLAKSSLGKASSSQENSNWVYVTATRFEFTSPFGCDIDFTRSSNKAQTWSSPPQSLDSSGGECGLGANPVVQGSRPNGGLGNGVLVAWYHSGADGWLSGGFNIRTRYSANNGATFAPVVVAAADEFFELPFWLGPFAAYHRWWGGMFPDVEISPNGSGHIAYTHDPVAGSASPEDGNIRYIGSAAAPYGAWSAPATVNDDASGNAQGWATLEADSKGNQAQLYAIWEDHRTSPSDNLEYDIFFAKRVGSGPWSNAKLTDARSRSDFIFLGDYFDITVAKGGDDDDGRFVFGVWTDRRDEPGIFDFDDDIWGARIDKDGD